MTDDMLAFEIRSRGGSDSWDQGAAGSILSKELFGESLQTTPRRAIYLLSGVLREIPTALLGTGIKPIVILTDGTKKERATVEGQPLIMDNGTLRTLNASTETLLI